MDVFSVSAILGIITVIAGAILKTINLLRYLEGELKALRSAQKIQKSKTESALIFLDFRIRDLEKFQEKLSGFQPRFSRDEETGSPFFDE